MSTVRSLSQRRQGSAPRVGSGAQAGAIRAAAARWAPHQAQVAGLPWSQVPPQMLQDFVRAVALDIQADYGAGAVEKSLEMLAAQVAPILSREPVRLHAAWAASPARLDLELCLDAAAPASRPDVAFELDVPAGTDEAGVRQALRQWAQAPAAPRLVFDPLAMLPAGDLVPLCRQLEALLAQAPEPDHDIGVVLSAAAVLVWWQRMEQLNATDGRVALAGIHSAGRELCSGQQVVMTARRQGLEPQPGPAATQGDPTVPATVSWRRHS